MKIQFGKKKTMKFLNEVENKFKTNELAKYGYILICPLMHDLEKEEAKSLIEEELGYKCQDIPELNYYIKVLKIN
jgi:hypothetical protein